VPTYQPRPRFLRDFKRLTSELEKAWEAALDVFVESLRIGRFDPALRVKRVRGYSGVWEMSWAADGRATFQYGDAIRPGEPHVIWRRIGTHAIFRAP
jgi:hypothetical protein